jgi:hypothetical protein
MKTPLLIALLLVQPLRALWTIPQKTVVWDGAAVAILNTDLTMVSREPLLRLDRPGAAPLELQRPPGMGRISGMTYAQGTAWVFGQRRDTGLQALARSVDLGTWEYVAVLPVLSARHGQPARLEPLGDGRFLATSSGGFWEGTDVSPLAIFAVDPKGELQYQRLVRPPSGSFLKATFTPMGALAKPEPAYPEMSRGQWELRRAGNALVALDPASGWILVLDGQDGHVTQVTRLYGGRPEVARNPNYPQAAPAPILGAQPRKDGQLLLLVRSEGYFRETKLYFSRTASLPEGNPSTRRLHLLLQDRFSFDDYISRHPQLCWMVLDPATGRLRPEAPPAGIPRVWRDFRQYFYFQWWFRSDANIEVATFQYRY